MSDAPTLASRLAERNRQRALRAERLARLRPPASEDAEAALEDFLRALTGGAKPPALAPAAEPGAVLHFQRPPASPGAPERDLERDLDRLPGAGPGLVWALERAGLCRLADIAPLAPEELAAKLGPIGRLVPAQAWIDAARAAPPA